MPNPYNFSPDLSPLLRGVEYYQQSQRQQEQDAQQAQRQGQTDKLRGLQIQQAEQGIQQTQATAEQTAAFQEDSGNTNWQELTDVQSLLQKYPNQRQEIEEQYQFSDQLRKAGAGKVAAHAFSLVKKKDRAGLEALVKNPRYEPLINQIGPGEYTADSFLEEYDKNPEEALETVKDIGRLSMDKEEFERVFGAEQKPLTAYQEGQLKIGQDANQIKRDANDIKRLERDAAKLKEKLANAKTEKATEKIQQEINVKAAEQKTKQKNIHIQGQNAQRSLTENIKTLESLIQHKGFKSAVGWQGGTFTIPGTESAGFEQLLEKVGGQSFISSIQNVAGMGLGALSDAEGKKLGIAAAALSTTMSEEDFTTEVENIINKLVEEREIIKSRTPRDPDAKAPPAALQYLKDNPDQIDNFEQKFGYRPEGY